MKTSISFIIYYLGLTNVVKDSLSIIEKWKNIKNFNIIFDKIFDLVETLERTDISTIVEFGKYNVRFIFVPYQLSFNSDEEKTINISRLNYNDDNNTISYNIKGLEKIMSSKKI